MRRVKRLQAVFLMLGAGQGACYIFLLMLGNLRRNIIACEAGFVAAFILYAASLFLIRTRPDTSHYDFETGSGSFFNRHYYLISIVGFALFFRVIMLFSLPSLSDDIYRYVWEGKMVSAGINPFEYAPADPALKQFRDEHIFPFINFSDLAAIYPPLSQFIFSTTAMLSPTLTAMNLTFTLFDVATIVVLILTMKGLGFNANRVIIYAWNPLIIMEFAGSGHLDSAGIFFLFSAFYLFSRKKDIGAIACLAFSFLNKLVAIMVLPFIPGRRKAGLICLFLFITALFYAPFLMSGSEIFSSLSLYSQKWNFNASLYDLLLIAFPQAATARMIAGFLFVSVLLGIFIFDKTKQHFKPERLYLVGYISFGALFLLTPVLYPWYLCWIVPFLVIIPNRAWIFLSGSVFLSYFVLKGYVQAGVWEENGWIKLLEYVPFYCLLLAGTVKKK